MITDPLEVIYRLQFDGSDPSSCELRVGGQPNQATLPDWAKLDLCQCSNCPLDASVVTWCPYAVALAEPLTLLKDRNSYDPVHVTVEWRERTLSQNTTLQRALSSFIGLLGARSGCPHTRLLEPMAHFHQPFSQGDETLFRMMGTYLIGQLLRHQQGLEPDFDLSKLADYYKQLRLVNQGLARRLRHASVSDQSVNGLVLLDILAAETQDLLDDLDESLIPIFSPYLQR